MESGAHDFLRVSSEDLSDDRFSRFRLIAWWDQERLRNANILVIGAGALGNEILKNLALLGVRRILIIDHDQIECSNLSRSVLYRARDVGRSKAETAALATAAIAEDATIHPLKINVLSEAGLGLFGWADVILAGLDNREARLWINRCAWKMDRPWIDGAIEGINGVARVFLPGRAPCYECTLGETDWAILERRMSCNLLTREEMLGGKTPTTPTTSSIIAGIEVQEALKLLHGLPVLGGRGFVFEGLNHSSYVVEYTENENCLSHETFVRMEEFPRTSDSASLRDLYAFARERLGADTELSVEFSRDVIWQLICPICHHAEEFFTAVGTVTARHGACPKCKITREVVTAHRYTGREPFGDRKLIELGLPRFDVFVARTSSDSMAIIVAGDREAVLGPLAQFKPHIWETVRSNYQ
jgi:molybdopterin/thiamine biosynthesis adenylyltransferase